MNFLKVTLIIFLIFSFNFVNADEQDKRNQITIKNNFRRGENLYNFFRNFDFSVPTLIKFNNIHLIVFKSKENIHCISAACPHLGISLIDGFFEKDKVICPGHGIAFSMENGMSSCKKFKTASYKVTITKDKFLIS